MNVIDILTYDNLPGSLQIYKLSSLNQQNMCRLKQITSLSSKSHSGQILFLLGSIAFSKNSYNK